MIQPAIGYRRSRRILCFTLGYCYSFQTPYGLYFFMRYNHSSFVLHLRSPFDSLDQFIRFMNLLKCVVIHFLFDLIKLQVVHILGVSILYQSQFDFILLSQFNHRIVCMNETRLILWSSLIRLSAKLLWLKRIHPLLSLFRGILHLFLLFCIPLFYQHIIRLLIVLL